MTFSLYQMICQATKMALVAFIFNYITIITRLVDWLVDCV